MEINKILKTESAKRNFLIGLVYLAKADGVVDESEKVFFLNAGASLKLSKESIDEINSCWTKDAMPEITFETKKEKLFFLIQAVQLCNVDNAYTVEEKEFVHKIASDLGVTKESVEKIEAWVKEGIEWQAKGDMLLEVEE